MQAAGKLAYTVLALTVRLRSRPCREWFLMGRPKSPGPSFQLRTKVNAAILSPGTRLWARVAFPPSPRLGKGWGEGRSVLLVRPVLPVTGLTHPLTSSLAKGGRIGMPAAVCWDNCALAGPNRDGFAFSRLFLQFDYDASASGRAIHPDTQPQLRIERSIWQAKRT